MTPYYDDGRGIVIYCVDCRSILPALKADVVISDPPYGVLAETGSAATRRSGGNRDNGKMAWDIAPDRGTLTLIENCAPVRMFWGGLHLELGPTFGYLVWDKQIDGLNFGEAEVCWTNMKFAPRIFHYRAVGVDGGKIHPTQKPLALMLWCMKFAPEGTILDPYMGSGTTLVAAKQMGRKCIGVEIDERWCEVAAKRLGQDVLDFEPPVRLSL